jgi:hypothetical protein
MPRSKTKQRTERTPYQKKVYEALCSILDKRASYTANMPSGNYRVKFVYGHATDPRMGLHNTKIGEALKYAKKAGCKISYAGWQAKRYGKVTSWSLKWWSPYNGICFSIPGEPQ